MVSMEIVRDPLHFNPQRRPVDIEGLERELALLEQQELSYEDLMRGYNKGLMITAKRRLKDFHSQKRIKRIK